MKVKHSLYTTRDSLRGVFETSSHLVSLTGARPAAPSCTSVDSDNKADRRGDSYAWNDTASTIS